MNRGQFDLSKELVAAVNPNAGGGLRFTISDYRVQPGSRGV